MLLLLLLYFLMSHRTLPYKCRMVHFSEVYNKGINNIQKQHTEWHVVKEIKQQPHAERGWGEVGRHFYCLRENIIQCIRMTYIVPHSVPMIVYTLRMQAYISTIEHT